MGEYTQWLAHQEPQRFRRVLLKRAWERGQRFLSARLPMLERIAPKSRDEASSPIPEVLRRCVEKKDRQSCRVEPGPDKLRVVQYIGGLVPGGAERQLCNFVCGATHRGWNMRVLISNQMDGDYAHYADLLHRVSVFPASAGARFDPEFIRAVRPKQRETANVLMQLPQFLLPWTVDIFGELLAYRPHILHAWLDHTNVWGGVAALLADVPIIILSTRNVNPDHFPYLAHPLFKPLYQLMAAMPGVHFINNSVAGACDYAAWLGLPEERFHVVRNGVDFSSVLRPTAAEVGQFRQELGLSDESRLVTGIFRLSDEKQPLVFAEVVSRVMRSHPRLHAIIAGVGPCEAEFREAIARNGVADRFHLLGRRKDIATIISAADVLMLTSRHEGTPNVLLEAQWLGRPVVSTRAGGAADAVSHEETGLLVNVGDVDGLTAALALLLDDDDCRRRLGQAGPRFIESHFGLDRMVEETLGVYDAALAEAGKRH